MKTATRIEMLGGTACCAKCQGTDNLQVDHIWPGSLGGREDPINYQVLCRTCNIRKGDSILKDDLLRAEWRRLDDIVDLKQWGRQLADTELKQAHYEIARWKALASALANRMLATRLLEERRGQLALAEKQHERTDGKIGSAAEDLLGSNDKETSDACRRIMDAIGFVKPGNAAPDPSTLQHLLGLLPFGPEDNPATVTCDPAEGVSV